MVQATESFRSDIMPTVQEFEIAYVRLSQQPDAKIPPGLSYEQLLDAWEKAGRPSDIDQFLIHGKARETVQTTEGTA
jgi:hypothetical protein